MTDFSYGYCAALLKKLKELKGEGRIFQDNEDAAKAEVENQKGCNYNTGLTLIAASVVNALQRQVAGFKIVDEFSSTPSRVGTGIAVVEEFLAIFEKKSEYSGGPESPPGD